MYFFGWYGFNLSLISQMLFIVILSPLVPDLDHKMGKLYTWIMMLGFSVSLLGIIYWKVETTFSLGLGNNWLRIIILGILISGITFFNAHFSSHRGIWHSIPMAIIYGSIITIITGLNYQLGILGAFGFWSHLLCDKIPFKMK